MSDITPRTYRLLTRSDMDGLVCAVLLKELGMLGEIVFQHGSELKLLDLATETVRTLEVTIPGDRPALVTSGPIRLGCVLLIAGVLGLGVAPERLLKTISSSCPSVNPTFPAETVSTQTQRPKTPSGNARVFDHVPTRLFRF